MEYLKVVNKKNRLERNYIPENMVEIHQPTGEKIDLNYVNQLNKEAYAHFLDMQQDALKEGYEIFIDSSYRSYDYQQKVFDDTVRTKGIEYANRYCSLPGSSEHQTGLAFDVIIRRDGKMQENSYDDDEEIIWLMNNCHKYGYILRYPKGKEDITGYNYERWHYRYVGKEVAEEMYYNDIATLEEYVLLKQKTKKRVK